MSSSPSWEVVAIVGLGLDKSILFLYIIFKLARLLPPLLPDN